MSIASVSSEDVDVIAQIRAHSNAGRIAFIEGEEFNKAITFERLHHAALAFSNYLSCLYLKNAEASVLLANRWEIIAFYLGVQLTGGSVRILDYDSKEDELAMAFRDSKIILSEGRDIRTVYQGTLAKQVKIITIATKNQPYNGISIDDVFRIRINRSLIQENVTIPNKTISMLTDAVREVHPRWNPVNSQYAVMTPLHRPAQIQLIMACMVLGLPVLMIDNRKIGNFTHYSRNHAIEILSIDMTSLEALQKHCDVALRHVEIVFFDGIITTDIKTQLLRLFPQVQAIREVSDEITSKL